MKYPHIVLSLTCLLASAAANASEVTTLLSQPIPATSAREGLMVRVVLAPGEASAAHRHNAQTFVYVESGTVAMAVNGEEAVTLHAGDTFYETPDDVHSISRNLDASEEAVLLVFMVKEPGAAATMPASP